MTVELWDARDNHETTQAVMTSTGTAVSLMPGM